MRGPGQAGARGFRQRGFINCWDQSLGRWTAPMPAAGGPLAAPARQTGFPAALAPDLRLAAILLVTAMAGSVSPRVDVRNIGRPRLAAPRRPGPAHAPLRPTPGRRLPLARSPEPVVPHPLAKDRALAVARAPARWPALPMRVPEPPRWPCGPADRGAPFCALGPSRTIGVCGSLQLVLSGASRAEASLRGHCAPPAFSCRQRVCPACGRRGSRGSSQAVLSGVARPGTGWGTARHGAALVVFFRVFAWGAEGGLGAGHV